MPATEPIREVAALVRAVGEAPPQDGFWQVAVRGDLAGFTRRRQRRTAISICAAPEGEAGCAARCSAARRRCSTSPRDGQQGRAARPAGDLSRGELQMIVEAMRPAGEGR